MKNRFYSHVLPFVWLSLAQFTQLHLLLAFSGPTTYTTCCNTPRILATQCICKFRVGLPLNDNRFPKHQLPIALYNGHCVLCEVASEVLNRQYNED